MSSTSFILPDLASYCPYPLRTHAGWSAVAADSENWVLSGTRLSKKKKAALNGLKAGSLAATCYPDSDAYHLRLAADFMNYLFALDDLSDDLDAEGTARLADDVMAAFHDPEGYETESAAGKMAKCFFARFTATGGPRCARRFIETMDLFFAAVAQQAHDRTSGDIPDLEEYIALRCDTSGCKPCFALVECAAGIDLPDEVIAHPSIRALEDASNAFVTWSNDIFSYDVEQSRGDEHNMVAVLIREYGFSLQEGIDFVGDLCKATIDRFEQERLEVPSWGAETDRAVALYIDGLQNWIVGSLHWSFDSMRYFGLRGAAIKRDLIVKLTPRKQTRSVTVVGA